MSDVPTQLSPEEIKARLAGRREGRIVAEQAVAEVRYQYVRPFSTAADGYIEFVQNPEGRFMLGLTDVDAKTRGFGKGELAYITGKAHSGKTQVVMNALANHPHSKVLFFTPDEVSELILAKLVALRHGLNSEYVEQEIKARNTEVVRLVRETAEDTFGNLIVIDDSLTTKQMKVALEEARDFWGEDADAVVIDFLELIPGDGDASGVTAKSQELKRWTKDAHVPVICLHQASRSSGTRGQAAGMGAMRYGGETEAIFVLEVFRKREDPELSEHELLMEQNSVTINVAKNKRPPCHIGEVDYFMDPETGFIRPHGPGDRTVVQNDRVLEMIRGRAG